MRFSSPSALQPFELVFLKEEIRVLPSVILSYVVLSFCAEEVEKEVIRAGADRDFAKNPRQWSIYAMAAPSTGGLSGRLR